MILGIPIHPLAVHFGVVLGLLGAGAVLLAALWPRFRTWFGWGTPAAGVVAAVALRVTQSFGEVLEQSSPEYHSAAVHVHSTWGSRAGTAGIVLGVAGILLWLVTSPTARERWTSRWPTWVVPVAQVVAVVAAVATLVLVTMAGHTGASAVWTQ